MEFTKEEKRQIRKSRQAIVRDMRELWKIYPYEKLDIEVSFPDVDLSNYGFFWRLLIDSKRIILYSQSTNKYTNIERHRIHHLQDLYYTKGDYLAHFGLINQYDKIREQLKEILTKRKNKQRENIDKLAKVEERHSSRAKKLKKKLEAIVQIYLPLTNNQQTIEITEENGKKIGRIDFGAQTIKFITEGDIVLVNKIEENTKVKRK